VLDSFIASPDAVAPHGLSYDRANLLHTDSAGTRHKVYKHSGISVTIIDSFDTQLIVPATVPTGIAWIAVDVFTVTLQYKNAGGSFVSVTSALGDVGANVEPGALIAYWGDPNQDRTDVEINDAQVQLTLVPDGENSEAYSANMTSVSQMTSGDGIGAQGDVKVGYEIT